MVYQVRSEKENEQTLEGQIIILWTEGGRRQLNEQRVEVICTFRQSLNN